MNLPWLSVGVALTWLATARSSTRVIGLFNLSILAVFALQPSLPIRYLDFWLPLSTLGLTLWIWAIISPPERLLQTENWLSAGWMMAMGVGLTVLRWLPWPVPLTASTPPVMPSVIFFVAGVLAITALFSFLPRTISFAIGIFLLIGLLLILKSPSLSEYASFLLRTLNNQSPQAVSSFDIRWLGFSYIAFRLIHTLQDFRKGRLQPVSLQEYVVFVLFYPALTAGPIDRLERFVTDLRQDFCWKQIDWDFTLRRLTLGLFKKFVLADSLALMALSLQNATQITNAGWAWLTLYAYTLQYLRQN